jgi:hypothetical protein
MQLRISLSIDCRTVLLAVVMIKTSKKKNYPAGGTSERHLKLQCPSYMSGYGPYDGTWNHDQGKKGAL